MPTPNEPTPRRRVLDDTLASLYQTCIEKTNDPTDMSNPGNVPRGLKASISNPNTSEEAKKCAQERLELMQQSGQLDSREAQIKIGYKAALANPNVSEQAKEHSQQILEDLGD